MNKILPVIIVIALSATSLNAQNQSPEYAIHGNDTMPVYRIPPAIIFKSKRDERRNNKLVENLKKVYPIAKEANEILVEMDRRMSTMRTESERKEFTKSAEKMIQSHYEPVIRKMTISQGKLLVKLIDRETSKTPYVHLKEFRGNIRAFFWQSVSRIFGGSLKAEYDPKGEDWYIEELIMLIEAGFL